MGATPAISTQCRGNPPATKYDYKTSLIRSLSRVATTTWRYILRSLPEQTEATCWNVSQRYLQHFQKNKTSNSILASTGSDRVRRDAMGDGKV